MLFTLKLEPLAGTDFREAVDKAKQLIDRLGVNIEFNFNGVIVYVHQNSEVEHLQQEYSKAKTGDFIT